MHWNAITDKHCLLTHLLIISCTSKEALRVFTKKGFAFLSSLPSSQLSPSIPFCLQSCKKLHVEEQIQRKTGPMCLSIQVPVFLWFFIEMQHDNLLPSTALKSACLCTGFLKIDWSANAFGTWDMTDTEQLTELLQTLGAASLIPVSYFATKFQTAFLWSLVVSLSHMLQEVAFSSWETTPFQGKKDKTIFYK